VTPASKAIRYAATTFIPTNEGTETSGSSAMGDTVARVTIRHHHPTGPSRPQPVTALGVAGAFAAGQSRSPGSHDRSRPALSAARQC
jgi:hypothetical protein